MEGFQADLGATCWDCPAYFLPCGHSTQTAHHLCWLRLCSFAFEILSWGACSAVAQETNRGGHLTPRGNPPPGKNRAQWMNAHTPVFRWNNSLWRHVGSQGVPGGNEPSYPQGSREIDSKQASLLLLLTAQWGWSSSRKDRGASVTSQVVSFLVSAGTQPTAARGLFTKVILWHHPQKNCGNPCQSWHGNQTEGAEYSHVKHTPVIS